MLLILLHCLCCAVAVTIESCICVLVSDKSLRNRKTSNMSERNSGNDELSGKSMEHTCCHFTSPPYSQSKKSPFTLRIR